jgi:hypothetical protein
MVRTQVMKRIVVNGTLRTKLAKVKKTVELTDDKGRTLGTFTPEPFCPWDPKLTPAEADRIANEPGSTLKEILKKLGAK